MLIPEAHCWYDSGPESSKKREEGWEIDPIEPDPSATCDGSTFGVHFGKSGTGLSVYPWRGDHRVGGLPGAWVPR